jgi:hypothetical protein
MGTIRWRLAIWYAVALMLSLAGFGAAVASELRKPNVPALDAQLGNERDLAINYLVESYRVLGSLVPASTQALAPAIAAGCRAFATISSSVTAPGASCTSPTPRRRCASPTCSD